MKSYNFKINGADVSVVTSSTRSSTIGRAARKAVHKYLKSEKVEKKIRGKKRVRLDIAFMGVSNV